MTNNWKWVDIVTVITDKIGIIFRSLSFGRKSHFWRSADKAVPVNFSAAYGLEDELQPVAAFSWVHVDANFLNMEPGKKGSAIYNNPDPFFYTVHGFKCSSDSGNMMLWWTTTIIWTEWAPATITGRGTGRPGSWVGWAAKSVVLT